MINVIAQFKTTLVSGISATATTGVLESNASADNDGATIPDGDYGIVIDERNGNREYAIITVNGFDFTFVKRGLSMIDGDTEKAGNTFAHRKGAEIKIVSHPIIPLMTKILGGLEPFGGVPLLPADRILSNSRHVIDKEYADAISAAGIVSMLVSDAGGLNISVNTGTYILNGVVNTYDGTASYTLTDNSTNYVELVDSVLSHNTTAFSDDAIPLATVVTLSGDISSVTDKRPFYTGIDIKANYGINRDSSGIFIDLDTTPGLDFNSGKLKAKIKTSGGLVLDADGLSTDPAIVSTIQSMPAYENLVAGDLLKAINDSGTYKLKKIAGIGSLVDQVKSMSLDSLSFISLGVDKIAYIRGYSTTLYTAVGTIAGGVITFGSEVSVSSSTTNPKSQYKLYAIKKVATDKYLIVYPNEISTTNGTVYARVVSVSGTVVTLGTECTVETVVANFDYTSIQLSELEQDKFLLGWVYGLSSSSIFKTAVLSISGTAISVGSIDTNSLSSYYQPGSLVGMSSTVAVWIVPFDYTGYKISSFVYTISGTTISRGAEGTILSGLTSISRGITATKVSSDKIALFWYLAATLTTLQINLLSVSGNTVSSIDSITASRKITNSYPTVVDSISIDNNIYFSLKDLGYIYKFRSDNSIIIDTGLSLTAYGNYGNVMSIEVDKLINCSEYGSSFYFRKFLLDHDEFITSANASYSIDDNVPIVNMFTGFSSLINGLDYYINSSATGLTISPTYQKVGKAISATTILK